MDWGLGGGGRVAVSSVAFAVLVAGLVFAAGVQASGVSCGECSGSYSGTWTASVDYASGASASLTVNFAESLVPGAGGASAWDLTSASGTVGYTDQFGSCSASFSPNPSLADGLGNSDGPQVVQGAEITVDPWPPSWWSSDPQTTPQALVSSPSTGNSECDDTSLETSYESHGWSFTGSDCHPQITVPLNATTTSPDNCDATYSDRLGNTGTLTSTLTISEGACTCSCTANPSGGASDSGSAHVANDGPVALSFRFPDADPGNVRGFGMSIVATAVNGCPDYTFVWKLVNVEHYPKKPNYIRVTPTVKGDGPAKQSTLHVTLKCRVPPRVRRAQPDYWTRPCQSTITYLVRATDKRGKKSVDKDSMVKFDWRPECLTKEGVARIEEDEKHIVDDATGDLPADLRNEVLQHGLTTLAEWESLGATLLARGALGVENKIGNLAWAWERDQDWLQNRC
jgi:hypothetical protein